MKASPITEELYQYILNKSVIKEKLLDNILKETEKLNIPLIQISPDQGRFLYLLCKMIKAKNALEIGTLTGFSGVHIARGLKTGGKLITVELIKKHADIAKKYFVKAGLSKKTEVIVSPALKQMKKFSAQKKKFDFIFIDADKTSYPDYFKEALKLSKPGTVIAFDNMLKEGRVIQKRNVTDDLRAVQKTNDILSKNKKIEYMILTIGDGLGLAFVK